MNEHADTALVAAVLSVNVWLFTFDEVEQEHLPVFPEVLDAP